MITTGYKLALSNIKNYINARDNSFYSHYRPNADELLKNLGVVSWPKGG
jgi:hypothetical protein